MNKLSLVIIIAFAVLFRTVQAADISTVSPKEQRKYMVETLTKIAHPVLYHLSRNELKKMMPVEYKSALKAKTSYLEAFGRTLSGIAPWLALGVDDTEEGKQRKVYIDLAIKSIQNATDINSPDYLDFGTNPQTLVDAAFFSAGLLRAPKQLWEPLDDKTKSDVLTALKATRAIKPPYNNWLLFSAMVEAALLKFEGQCDEMRLDYAIKQHFLWYKGDGVYGDGPDFHFDYYNSYVIHPMLLDVLKTMGEAGIKQQTDLFKIALARAQRYAAIQEMLISPEATYPAVGRSITYRFGAFHLLSQIALIQALPQKVSPEQVRYALYNVVKRQVEMPNTFDENSWLKIGFSGYQPQLGEGYISTGSLYLCLNAFLILGLPPDNQLWQGNNIDWSSRKIWHGEQVMLDKAYKEKK